MSKPTMIGSKITEARKKINISQAQLAERLFISPQAVGKWERGESMPDIMMFSRLAELLGVDLNYFSDNFPSATTEISLVEPSANSPAESPSTEKKKKLSWDMSRQNLVDVDFSGLKNLHEKLSNSNIQRCQFVGANMSGLVLKSNNVASCDFFDADISNSNFQSCNVANSLFQNCSLKETEFSKSYVESCDFSAADFTEVSFLNGGFGKNKIENAIWKNTSFKSMHIADVVFEGAVEDCYFEGCSFANVKFLNATLTNTFFKHNSKMKRLQFIDCKADKLTYAFLKSEKADLTGICLLTE